MPVVVSRDVADLEESVDAGGVLHSALLEQMLVDLNARTRHCVAALGAPQAGLRIVQFPAMPRRDRQRAARFHVGEGDVAREEASVVRVHPIDRRGEACAVAFAKRRIVRSRVEVLRRAGLRVIGVDSDACALGRIFAGYDAIVDVGMHHTRLHVYRDGAPTTWVASVGGDHVTRAIASELAIDVSSAERRKRILGIAGAGEPAALIGVDAICGLFERARRDSERWSRVGFVGNGARLPGLVAAVGERLRVRAELPVPELLRTPNVDEQTVRVNAPDWALACALATWRDA